VAFEGGHTPAVPRVRWAITRNPLHARCRSFVGSSQGAARNVMMGERLGNVFGTRHPCAYFYFRRPLLASPSAPFYRRNDLRTRCWLRAAMGRIYTCATGPKQSPFRRRWRSNRLLLAVTPEKRFVFRGSPRGRSCLAPPETMRNELPREAVCTRRKNGVHGRTPARSPARHGPGSAGPSSRILPRGGRSSKAISYIGRPREKGDGPGGVVAPVRSWNGTVGVRGFVFFDGGTPPSCHNRRPA